MKSVIYNGTGAPVVIDADGRQLGGGEFGVGETTSDEVKAAVEAGSLVVVKESSIGKDSSPEAQAAKALLAETKAEARSESKSDTNEKGA